LRPLWNHPAADSYGSKPSTMSRLFVFSVFSFFAACQWGDDNNLPEASAKPVTSLKIASDIEPPPGYERMRTDSNSFGAWLRKIPLRKDNHVYLYNGELKRNQTAQFAVLDMTVGKKDLQQCADAMMRLRGEYLFSQKRFADIEFSDNAGRSYEWAGGNDRPGFERYLENVFGWCGSASLEKQLQPVAVIKDLLPGDVLIKGGFPGHAMIIMDVAVNKNGDKVFMLAQSYMPAQDIHIVRNPANDKLSPWYDIPTEKEIYTPQWQFSTDQLRRW
jgi:hypothetical protein